MSCGKGVLGENAVYKLGPNLSMNVVSFLQSMYYEKLQVPG